MLQPTSSSAFIIGLIPIAWLVSLDSSLSLARSLALSEGSVAPWLSFSTSINLFRPYIVSITFIRPVLSLQLGLCSSRGPVRPADPEPRWTVLSHQSPPGFDTLITIACLGPTAPQILDTPPSKYLPRRHACRGTQPALLCLRPPGWKAKAYNLTMGLALKNQGLRIPTVIPKKESFRPLALAGRSRQLCLEHHEDKYRGQIRIPCSSSVRFTILATDLTP